MCPFERPQRREDFQVAVICALKIEFEAVEALFDQHWDREEGYGKSDGDSNAYTCGRIWSHDVLLAHIPLMEASDSTSLAASFRLMFPNIHLGLLVGICGGNPCGSEGEEILLGDAIISTRLVQYGSNVSEPYFVQKSTLYGTDVQPLSELRDYLTKLSRPQSREELQSKLRENLLTLLAKDEFQQSAYPGVEYDKLFPPYYLHKHRGPSDGCNTCETCTQPSNAVCTDALDLPCELLGCDAYRLVPRSRLENAAQSSVEISATINSPLIHFGAIASGHQTVNNSYDRDQITKRGNVIAFESEGAGIWTAFPCVVIKGVCDYADSHRDGRWHKYAAATVASCTKAFLNMWRNDVDSSRQSVLHRDLRIQPTSPPLELTGADLLDAIFKNDTERVKLLAAKGQNLDYNMGDGASPLGVAVEARHLTVVLALLGAGAHANFPHQGSPPLIVATDAGSHNVVFALLKAGAETEKRDSKNRVALLIAVANGHEGIVRCLLEHGANLEARDETSGTSLHIAASGGDASILKVLLDSGADTAAENEEGHTALYAAMHRFDTRSQVATLLLDHNIHLLEIFPEVETPLVVAIRHQPMETVEILLKYGANSRGDKASALALHEAVSCGRNDILEALLKFDIDVNMIINNGQTAMHLAAREGFLDTARVLVKYGALVDPPPTRSRIHTPFFLAVQNGHIEFVQWLKDNGANFYVLNPFGYGQGGNAVHEAIEYNKPEMLSYLLEQDFDLELMTKGRVEETPLLTAARKNNVRMMKNLLAGGSDVHAKNRFGETALHLAASWMNGIPMMQILLSKGSSVLEQAKNGTTALHLAAEHGNLSAMDLLIHHGADVNALYKTTSKQISVIQQAISSASLTDAATIKAIQTLCKAGASTGIPSRDYVMTAINSAAELNKPITLAYLFENSTLDDRRDAEGNGPLHQISDEFKNPTRNLNAIVNVCVENGEDLNRHNADGYTPLFKAIKQKKDATLEALLRAGCDINDKRDGIGVLHFVVAPRNRNKICRMTELLVRYGADVNQRSDRRGLTPLIAACSQADRSLVATLLRLGADASMRDAEGLTPLHTAASGRRWEIMKQLISEGVHVDSQDRAGRTALHIVARDEWGHSKYIAKQWKLTTRTLLELGADPNVTDEKGQTPLDIAKRDDNQVVVEILELANVEEREKETERGSV